MKYWLHLHNCQPEEMVSLAKLAEEVGFEGVVGDDHWFMPAGSDEHDPNERGVLPWDYVFPDFFVTGAAILAQTTTLKFGSCIMVLGNRNNPFLAAKSAATLARLGQDRFILGVGMGWMRDEYDMAGVPFETRIPRTVEMIEVLRKLWGPQPVEHHGRFFDFPKTYALPRPEKPVPVYLGAVAPAALRRTGQIADGWMGMTTALPDLAGQIAYINEGRQAASRLDAPFEFMVGLTRNVDGSLPGRDEYKRAEDMGVTKGHFGPIEHVLGEPYPSHATRRKVIEDFAARIISRD